MKVCKFGGSSVADAGQIAKICDIVSADPERKIVVVSAPGKRHRDDIKVTDLLIACGDARLAGKPVDEHLAAVTERFQAICRDLGVAESVADDIAEALRATVCGDAEHAGRYLDAVRTEALNRADTVDREREVG